MEVMEEKQWTAENWAENEWKPEMTGLHRRAAFAQRRGQTLGWEQDVENEELSKV